MYRRADPWVSPRALRQPLHWDQVHLELGQDCCERRWSQAWLGAIDFYLMGICPRFIVDLSVKKVFFKKAVFRIIFTQKYNETKSKSDLFVVPWTDEMSDW